MQTNSVATTIMLLANMSKSLRSELKIQRIVKKALALSPRGGVRNDILVLTKLECVSDQVLCLEWQARNVHPWDKDLSSVRQSELFSQQALKDTESALIRLFRNLPEISQIDFRVLDPTVRRQAWALLAGKVERQDVIPAPSSQSIKMRLLMMGVQFLLDGGHLEPLEAKALFSPES